MFWDGFFGVWKALAGLDLERVGAVCGGLSVMLVGFLAIFSVIVALVYSDDPDSFREGRK